MADFPMRREEKSLKVVIPVRQPKHVRYVELHPCKNEMALFETVHLLQNVSSVCTVKR